MGLLCRAAHVVGVGVAGEHVVSALEPDPGGEHAQNLRVADVLRLGPVGVHQAVVERLVQALRPRVLGQPERSQRPRRNWRVVDEPVRLEDLSRAGRALKVAWNALGRVFGV